MNITLESYKAGEMRVAISFDPKEQQEAVKKFNELNKLCMEYNRKLNGGRKK